MLLYFDERVTTQAAKFCTRCNFLMTFIFYLFFLICSFRSVILLCPPAALNPPIDLISYFLCSYGSALIARNAQ